MPDRIPDQSPPPMTDEQLRFFTQQTRRAARRAASEAVKRYRRAATGGFLILLVGVGANTLEVAHQSAERNKASQQSREAVVQSGRAVAVNGCNQDFEARARIRSLLTRLKRGAEKQIAKGGVPPEQAARALAFYNQQLGKFTLIDCRKTEHLLTDDPDKPIPTVKPYYPGAPYVPKDLSGAKTGG